MNKVRGFTIVEVLIAMILGSIAISFSAWIFLTISKDFKGSREEYSFHTEILQLKSVLENDMDKAKTIEYDENSLKLIISDSTEIYYDFYETNLVRIINQVSDTFHLITGNFVTDYDNQQPKRLITLSFAIFQNDSTWGTLRFYKQYPESLGLKAR